MKFLWVCLFAGVFLLDSSTALKCFSCSSNDNIGCEANPSKHLEPEECTFTSAVAQIGATVTDWFSRFSDVTPSNAHPVCQKLVVLSGGKKIIERKCAIKSDKVDVCNELRRKESVESCSICESDACNGAISVQNLWVPIILTPTLAVILKTFIL